MPNFQPNHNGEHVSPTHRTNDIDNNHSDQDRQPVLLTTISVEQIEDESSQSVTDDNLSVRSEVDTDDINKNPEELLDEKTATDTTKATGRRSELKNSLPRDSSVDVLASKTNQNHIKRILKYLYYVLSSQPDRLQSLCDVDASTWGAPIPMFTPGNLCLPYLSLPYMDLLSDASVHSYTIGTSNILFQQKKHLADVFVNVEGATIETTDQTNADIRKQLQLTTEDLRFVDFLIRHMQAPRQNAEGSEQWIRSQFQAYMLALLRTSLLPDGNKESEPFNGFFVAQWKQTGGYRKWVERGLDERLETDLAEAVGHPFAGTLSVADMKLKIAQ